MDNLQDNVINEFYHNATIYELNVRQFSQNHNFTSIIQQLPRLKDLQIDIIWLMPIFTIGEKKKKGKLGSYYSVQDYKEINPEFGTKDDFKNLVNEIHKLKMKIILDWVANHTSTDHVWVEKNPSYYKYNPKNNKIMSPLYSWTDVYQLNFDNPDLRKEMINNLIYWVQNFQVDGFRCDVAMMMPPDFWIQAKQALKQVNNDIFLLGEAEENKIQMKGGFDMAYGFSLMQWMKARANGLDHKFQFCLGMRIGNTLQELKTYINKYQEEDMQQILKMLYVTNHDENSYNGGEYGYFNEDNVQLYTVLAYTLPGMPLVYNGQEIPLKKKLERFENDQIQWGELKNEQFLKTLLCFHHKNKAMWNGPFGGKFIELANNQQENVLSFSRQKEDNKAIVVLNFSAEQLDVTIDLTQQLIDKEKQSNLFRNIFTGEMIEFKQKENDSLYYCNFKLNKFGFNVLENVNQTNLKNQ